jgi:hypothetical protein
MDSHLFTRPPFQKVQLLERSHNVISGAAELFICVLRYTHFAAGILEHSACIPD